MGYLFAAFAIVWVVLFLYLFRLAKQGQEIRKELAALKCRLEEEKKG